MSPGGFRQLRAGPVLMFVDPRLADAAARLGLLQAGGAERLLSQGGGSCGRARTAVVRLPGRSERLHLRAVLHGGWLGGLRRDRLIDLTRPIAELGASAQLAATGAPVARTALVVGQRRAPLLWTAAVGTLHEEDTRDGAEFLASNPSRERVLRAAAAAGRAVRQLHEAGGRHADLHVKNLLVRERDPETEVIVVDLDGARVVPALHVRERMAQLMRLYRSLVKRRLLERVAPGACTRFLAHYTDGDRGLRRTLLARLPRERLRLRLHALAYGR